MGQFLFFGFLIFRMFFRSKVLSVYEVVITIFTEFGFSFSPLFIYQELSVGEKKDRRQGRFHSQESCLHVGGNCRVFKKRQFYFEDEKKLIMKESTEIEDADYKTEKLKKT